MSVDARGIKEHRWFQPCPLGGGGGGGGGGTGQYLYLTLCARAGYGSILNRAKKDCKI
jgi:hypothetical protein